jgi:hypothetical protein
MTLADLLTAPIRPAPDELRGLWLVIPAALAANVAAKQAALGNLRHRVAPVAGPDGTHVALCADLCTEIGPGGLYREVFGSLDGSQFAHVQVRPRADLEAEGWFAAAEEEI